NVLLLDRLSHYLACRTAIGRIRRRHHGCSKCHPNPRPLEWQPGTDAIEIVCAEHHAGDDGHAGALGDQTHAALDEAAATDGFTGDFHPAFGANADHFGPASPGRWRCGWR